MRTHILQLKWLTGLVPRDACSAKRGIARLSRLSVCLSVCPSVTLTYRGRIGWTSSKLIIRIRHLCNVAVNLLAASRDIPVPRSAIHIQWIFDIYADVDLAVVCYWGNFKDLYDDNNGD